VKLRILWVDVPLKHERVEMGSFRTADAFSDYDVVVIDPAEISAIWSGLQAEANGRIRLYAHRDGGTGKALSELMQRRSDETKMLLERVGGILICFLRRKENVLERAGVRGGTLDYIDLYSWIPTRFYEKASKEGVEEFLFSGLSYSTEPRSGKQIVDIDFKHPFSQYFQAFQGRIRFEVVVKLEEVEQSSTIIARNKVGEVIAFELPFGQGKMIFLPPAPIKYLEDRKKAAGVLLSCVSSMVSLPVPSTRAAWLDKYSLPGENEHQKEIQNLGTQIQRLGDRKRELEEKQDVIGKLKGILDLRGKLQLEPLVREAFRKLGFKVLNREEYEEPYDLYMFEGKTPIVGEIEGTEGQVDIQKFRQLLGYVTERVTETGEQCKGILVANAYADKDPPKRGEQFTKEVIRGCSTQKYCRITTWELFKALRAVLLVPSDRELKKRIRKAIIESDGEFIFDTS